MTRKPRLGRLPAALAVLVALLALALPTVAMAGNLRAILGEVEGEVMCPVCGELLELAESPQATREKAFIEKLAKEGKNKDEIKQALVNQYGDAVLALPQGSGFSLSAYVVPIVAFVIAVIALALGVWRWRVSTRAREKEEPEVEGPSDEERERLDADLARYDL
ncbi:MAG: cytochrome c-type biogenesis protein CcmH [Solirubrobacterales bacterium]